MTLDQDCFHFSQQLGAKASPGSWAHPQLVTQELRDCKGPEAEWLVESVATREIVADTRALATVPEGDDVQPDACLTSSSSTAEPGMLQMLPLSPRSSSWQSIGGDSCSSMSSPLSSPEEPTLLPAPPLALGCQAYGVDAGQQQSGEAASFLIALHNPMFEAERGAAGSSGAAPMHLPATPDGRRAAGQAAARVTPGSTPGSDADAPATKPARAVEEGSARNLEAQLLSAGVPQVSALDAAELQQLRSQLAALEGDVARLREEKASSELQAAALLDEVQLSFAALEASQHARQQAELQHAQVSCALQSALGEQGVLVRQVEQGRQEVQAALSKVERLEYQIELMQCERQEMGGAGQYHTTSTISPETLLDSLAGGELVAELERLRAALGEANRSKAVLASKLQQCRTDNAQLVGRLQASQARHAAELECQAVASQGATAQLRRELNQLRAENQQLAAQVQLLQRQAAAGSDNERGAALAGIVRQREEQLVSTHLEMAGLQARLRECASAQERCAVLEARTLLLLRQHETLADKLHAAQHESASWRSTLSKLSDELAACTSREAQAKSALHDTAARLLVQQQVCDAQGEELELLRRVGLGGSWAAQQQQQPPQPAACVLPPPQLRPSQPLAQQQRAAHAEHQQQPSWSPTIAAQGASLGGGGSVGAMLDAGNGMGRVVSARVGEDDGTPTSKKTGKFSWLKFKTSN